MAASPDTHEYNASIDWMRALSIIYIAGFWHLFGYSTVWKPNNFAVFFRITVVALGLFVFISGYLLASGKVIPLGQSTLKFWIRRLIRIYPPYLVAIVVFAGCGLLNASP